VLLRTRAELRAALEAAPRPFGLVPTMGWLHEGHRSLMQRAHADSATTVVAILFNLVGAERAYFGQKDAQQLLVIRQMARDLAIPTEVIGCPTVREPDGLAMSSRNVHLSPAERAAAPVLRRALEAGRRHWMSGERSADAIRRAMRAVLDAEPLANPEYVSVADGVSLRELETIDGPALLSLAVRFGSTRLIDNEPLT